VDLAEGAKRPIAINVDLSSSPTRLTQDVYTVADMEALRCELERMSFGPHVAGLGQGWARKAPKDVVSARRAA